MRYLTDLREVKTEQEGLAGGKAKSLAFILQKTKIRIPEGYVLLADAAEGGLLKADAEEEIRQLCEKLDDKFTYAVRSSALNEDGAVNSFAGQYETVTDVRPGDIADAVKKVLRSSDSERVRGYKGTAEEDNRIGVVIQRFVKARFAGVVFTSDAISGADDHMSGNYVHGAGEALVSGSENAYVFRINSIRYGYDGPAEMAPYAKTLYRYCMKIRKLYGVPMDIEWAVAEGKVYILQARPITTLRRLDIDSYNINGSLSSEKLLTRTNVGEIFMKPVSPITFSILERINSLLGLPDWLDNIYGQAYMNISVLVSLQVAFGAKPGKAYKRIESLLGKIPDDLEIPISPFDRKAFLKAIKKLIFPEKRSKLSRKQMHQMVLDMDKIAREMIDEIKTLKSNPALMAYWEERMLPALNDGLASVMKESGSSLVPLFSTPDKIAKYTDEELAERLISGCLGVVESMKPLLLISDVAKGKLSAEDYIRICGHRCVNEMELMEPRPYEQDDYVSRLIDDQKMNPTDMHSLLAKQHRAYEEAMEELADKYPGKRKKVEKLIAKYKQANAYREDIRSKGVWIFCIFREFLLQTSRINDLGDDVFMFTCSELFDYLKGDKELKSKLAPRRRRYEEYLSYPTFPNLISGRFIPEEWMADPGRRNDHFIYGRSEAYDGDASIKGYPGAAGCVSGRVKLITDIKDIDLIEKGDILVTTATNIGWTPVFSKVSAIVTDIGAPLSHAAIVAREFGIPAVVGCGNATTILKTGDLITVNGAKGTVSFNS